MNAPKAKALTGQINLASPWDPAIVAPGEAAAINALTRGEATAQQQGLIVKWIERATAVGEMSYRPTGDRDTAFAEGKRFVGLQFFTLAKARISEPRQG